MIQNLTLEVIDALVFLQIFIIKVFIGALQYFIRFAFSKCRS